MMAKEKSIGQQDSQLDEALAILISCTRSKIRPLPLTQIAKWLEIAVSKLGSISAVADRIGLSSKMLRQFAYVRRLSRRVQNLFEKRKLDSVDAATHLAMLPISEQQEVAEALVDGKIDTIDLRAVVELRKLGQTIPVSRLLRRVTDSKVKQQYIAEFVVRGNRSQKDILSAFAQHIPPSEIVSLELEGALGRVVLTPKGKNALAKTARTFHVSLKNVIPKILHI